MSYCRWSSMTGMCDVYVYEDVRGGWTTHVAARRRALPPVPDILGSSISMAIHRWSGCYWDRKTREMVYPHRWRALVYRPWIHLAWIWHNRVHLGSLRIVPLRPIGLPHDGESFSDPTPADCADRLVRLRALGYKVPQHAIDALRSDLVADNAGFHRAAEGRPVE